MIKWAYILIGNDRTGKTTFQKEILRVVNFAEYKKLNCNLVFPVNVRIGKNNTKKIFFMNRSYQEKITEYQTVQNYFSSFFKEADACILSSHLDQIEIEQMINELKKRFYNICGVFFENSIFSNKSINEGVALLDWDEKYIIENPIVDNENWEYTIKNSAIEFSNHILSKM
jgi:hypothetical protein